MGGMDDGEKAVLWGLHDDSAPSTGGCCPWRFRMQNADQRHFDRRQKSKFLGRRLEEKPRGLTLAQTATMADHSRDPWYAFLLADSERHIVPGSSLMILVAPFPWGPLEVPYGMA